MATTVKAYGVTDQSKPLKPLEIQRRAPGPKDVSIEILFAGICHSDIHTAEGDWGPMKGDKLVPGHEIVGVVKSVGAQVTKFTVGQQVGVGCMVDSCRSCGSCKNGEEQYCENGFVGTYGAEFKYDHCEEKGGITQGGYSQAIVVDESFVCSIPEGTDLASTAPLLCAGITMYSPMVKYGLKPGQKLGIAGLGGLGHVAVKLGVAMGAEVTVFSRGTKKMEDALKLGAHHFVDSTSEEEMKAAAGKYDLILDSISAPHDFNAFLGCLKLDGTCVVIGAGGELKVQPFNLFLPRRHIGGSLIGGIEETQEMLNFCAKHNITCDIELIDSDYINTAYERVKKSDIKYRFVIDAKSFK